MRSCWFLVLVGLLAYSGESIGLEATQSDRPADQTVQSATLDQVRQDSQAAWDRGDHETAIVYYAELLRRGDLTHSNRFRMAQLYGWTNRFEQSLALLEKLQIDYPDDLDIALLQVRVLAWGEDFDAAIPLITDLAAHHADIAEVLSLQAQLAFWQGQHESALTVLDQLIALEPQNLTHLFTKARVLLAAVRLEEASATLRKILDLTPDHRDTLVELARLEARLKHPEAAETIFRTTLELYPGDVDAMSGLATVLRTYGKLAESEAVLREALRLYPENSILLADLSCTLRWQGRHASAQELVRDLQSRTPLPAVLGEKLQPAGMITRAEPILVIESDSDENRMQSLSVKTIMFPRARLGLRIDAYTRSLEINTRSFRSQGATVAASYALRSEWLVSSCLGFIHHNGTNRRTTPTARMSLVTPGHYHLGGMVSYLTYGLDSIARQIEVGVKVHEWAAGGWWLVNADWQLHGGINLANYHGTQHNRQFGISGKVVHNYNLNTIVGLGLRTFGFVHDVTDGYFDPDFYTNLEASVRRLYRHYDWHFVAEAAPGFQYLKRAKRVSPSLMCSLRLTRVLPHGREISLSLIISNVGLQSSASGDGSYAYRALGLAGGWGF